MRRERPIRIMIILLGGADDQQQEASSYQRSVEHAPAFGHIAARTNRKLTFQTYLFRSCSTTLPSRWLDRPGAIGAATVR